MIDMSKADSVNEIKNMLYQYCWNVDHGKFDAIGEQFKYADIAYEGEIAYQKDPEAFAASFRDNVKTYDDGTPHTFHMCIDPIIEVDVENGTATANHYTVVLQGYTDKIAPFVMIMDYKYDKLEYVDGAWRFTYRNMCNRATGDMSNHISCEWG